jgi:hypothetical protein
MKLPGWIANVSRKIDVKCWEEKECGNEQCPAYKNTCGRCWIIAGTMLPGEAQCSFAKKYQSFRNCEVYQKFVYRNPIVEVEEYLIVLIHSLRSKQQELNLDSNTDFLTKLYNRRFMDSYLHHEILKLYSNSDIVEALVEADKNMYLDKAARKKQGTKKG